MNQLLLKLKNSITIILVLFIFVSPKDQKAEQPAPKIGLENPGFVEFKEELKLTPPVDTTSAPHAVSISEHTKRIEIVDHDESINLERDIDIKPGSVDVKIFDDILPGNIPLEVPPAEEVESVILSTSASLNSEAKTQNETPHITLHVASSQHEVEPSATDDGDATTTEVNISEDSIPSFSEWTKLQLAQRKESVINNVKNKTSAMEGKNFASPDCGAKILTSNPESHNPSGVISSSHDEYMLNRCTTNVWFVLELCEPVTIERISIGNVELFSSNPHELELSVSDRHPLDWVVFGPYYAPDSRSMHVFHLPPNNSTFGKYLRVVIKSHHGSEHYCPLSLIKVYGKSEYEVLESETIRAEDVTAEVASIVEEEIAGDKSAQNSVLGTATAVVMDMMKKAADVLVSKKPFGEGKDTKPEEPQTVVITSTNCITLLQCVHPSDFKADVLRTLSCNSQQLEWLSNNTPWCGWEYCHFFLNGSSIGSPWMPEGLFIAIFGPYIIDSLCHYKNPLQVCNPIEHNLEILKLAGVFNGTTNDTLNVSPSPTGSIREEIGSDSPVIGNSAEFVLSQSKGTNQPVAPQVEQPPNFNSPNLQPPIEEPTQKESVFVRLSNRIKALERNQSLSSGYLEELSQRFRKQNEEIHSSHEQFRKTLNESLTKCSLVEQSLRYEVRRLNRNVETLRDLIWRVELQRSGLLIFGVVQILCTFLFCWFNRKAGVHERIHKHTTGGNSSGIDTVNVLSNQRKRSYSHPPPSRSRKKKKRKEAAHATKAVQLIKTSQSNGLQNPDAGIRIPSSLSTGSIPLRLPPQSTSAFQFMPPNIFPTPKFSVSNTCVLPVIPASFSTVEVPVTSAGLRISNSESSEEVASISSSKSGKRKSKLKAFLFGK